MKENLTLVDESGIEVLVCFTQEKDSPEDTHEDDFGTRTMVYTELHSVEVIIKGTGIDILPLMNERQKMVIVEQINDRL